MTDVPGPSEPAGLQWENPVKVRLRAGQPVFGVTVTTPSLEAAARLAAVGFDFLWVEMEHSPLTLETLRHIVLATRALPAVPFARVPVAAAWTAKRVLDAGACGVIFPFASTPEIVQEAVAACKYPPAGCRGSGAGLVSPFWPGGADRYYDSADCNVMVIAIIEEARALERVDDIAATPGVDALFIGTSDLSFSMGYRGRQEEPRLEAAIAEIQRAAQTHRKPVGRPVATVSQAHEYIDQGFLLFQTASDVGLMEAGARQFLEPLGRGRQRSHDRPLY